MRRSSVVGAVILLAVLGGALFALGGGGSSGDAADGGTTDVARTTVPETPTTIQTTLPATPQPTETDQPTPSPTATPPPTTAGQPFNFSIDQVEECGRTCRRVTATVTNRQAVRASNVSLDFQAFAGNGTDGRRVWNATESAGTLDPDESRTVTRQIDLSLEDVYAISEEDGWITVETTIRSENASMTTTERRNVD